MKKILFCVALFVSIMITTLSFATILSTTGDISLISPPSSVFEGALESSNKSWVFAERQNFYLTDDLFVDELASSKSFGSISAGSTINSFFFHSDPLGFSRSLSRFSGSIVFNTPIIGVIWSGLPCDTCPSSSMLLDASDFLGAPEVLYPTNVVGRGSETDVFYGNNGTQDFISISPDYHSIHITVNSFARYPDQIRIITTPVPEPSTMLLIGSGLFCLGVIRKKYKK